MDYNKIAKTSPMNEYWNSSQSDMDEENRIRMANGNIEKSFLYINEPYKWEQLYQSIIIEILRGDSSSLKGLNILLDSLNTETRSKVISLYTNQSLFNNDILNKLENFTINNERTKTNYLRFLRILFAIFTNPYCIHYRRPKKHLYEITGYFFFKIRLIPQALKAKLFDN